MGLFGPNQNLVAFQAIAAHFGQPISGSTAVFSLVRGGRGYGIAFSQYKQTITLRIAVSTGPQPDVELRKESGTDRFGKKIGLNYELQTGDALFDSYIFVVCGRDTALLKRMLEPAPVRKGALFVLQSANFDTIEFNKDGFTTTKVLGTSFSLSATQFEELFAALEMMEQDLPSFAEHEIRRSGIKPLSRVVIALGVMGVAGIVMLIAGNTNYQPLDNALYFAAIGLGLGAWFISLVVMGRLLRAKPDAFRAWLTWCFVGLGVLPLLAVGSILVLNGSQDKSAPVVHTAPILNMRTTRHKNSTSYYMQLKSWRPGESSVEIKVPGSYYSNHTLSKTANVTTKSGWLGWEWVASP